jgi:hypothetical protein
MKKAMMIGVFAMMGLGLSAQTVNFEDVVLDSTGYYNGSDLKGGFTSNGVFFPTAYDTTYFYWSGGFAASNIQDDTTAGFMNIYGAYAGKGYNNSANYVVAQNYSGLKFPSDMRLNSFYITNTTYAGLSMRDGDDFAKKFGGTDGNDKDFFTVTVYGYINGVKLTDSILVYLADYRFDNNSEDYILKDWTKVEVPLGLISADSISFALNSSDIGQFGMNTPAFFAIDEMSFSPILSVKNSQSSIVLYPNPAQDVLYSESFKQASIQVYDVKGNVVLVQNAQNNTLDISMLNTGMYFIQSIANNTVSTGRFIKQ